MRLKADEICAFATLLIQSTARVVCERSPHLCLCDGKFYHQNETLRPLFNGKCYYQKRSTQSIVLFISVHSLMGMSLGVIKEINHWMLLHFVLTAFHARHKPFPCVHLPFCHALSAWTGLWLYYSPPNTLPGAYHVNQAFHTPLFALIYAKGENQPK